MFFIAIMEGALEADIVCRGIGLLHWLRTLDEDSASGAYEYENRKLRAAYSTSQSARVWNTTVMQMASDVSIPSALCDHHNDLLRISCFCYGFKTIVLA